MTINLGREAPEGAVSTLLGVSVRAFPEKVSPEEWLNLWMDTKAEQSWEVMELWKAGAVWSK